jgi:hypothetical protein
MFRAKALRREVSSLDWGLPLKRRSSSYIVKAVVSLSVRSGLGIYEMRACRGLGVHLQKISFELLALISCISTHTLCDTFHLITF